jgi:hypothetical protein
MTSLIFEACEWTMKEYLLQFSKFNKNSHRLLGRNSTKSSPKNIG